jgi:hypothetical protein
MSEYLNKKHVIKYKKSDRYIWNGKFSFSKYIIIPLGFESVPWASPGEQWHNSRFKAFRSHIFPQGD